jgi:hypothetical protein
MGHAPLRFFLLTAEDNNSLMKKMGASAAAFESIPNEIDKKAGARIKLNA